MAVSIAEKKSVPQQSEETENQGQPAGLCSRAKSHPRKPPFCKSPGGRATKAVCVTVRPCPPCPSLPLPTCFLGSVCRHPLASSQNALPSCCSASVAMTPHVCSGGAGPQQAQSLPSGLQIYWELRGLCVQVTSSHDPAGSSCDRPRWFLNLTLQQLQ